MDRIDEHGSYLDWEEERSKGYGLACSLDQAEVEREDDREDHVGAEAYTGRALHDPGNYDPLGQFDGSLRLLFQ